MDRDFSTISPSAKSIILMKGYTSIPFAKQAAELISYPNDFMPDYKNTDLLFWGRLLHFETRYLSINQLIEDIDVNNFLELSSGFSFRGLEVSKKRGVYYIDTDLPAVISKKKEMLNRLDTGELFGQLELLPLNVLDEIQFRKISARLPLGKIAIINEGLLIYFNRAEKEKLCQIIHKILEERGGYWITSDIYIKAISQDHNLKVDKKLKDFSEQHNIEDNKFSSFEEAKIFFENNGFKIDKEEDIDVSKLSSFEYFLRSMKGNISPPKGISGKIQTTWRLKISD